MDETGQHWLYALRPVRNLTTQRLYLFAIADESVRPHALDLPKLVFQLVRFRRPFGNELGKSNLGLLGLGDLFDGN